MADIKDFFDQIKNGVIKEKELEIILIKITNTYNLSKTKLLLDDFIKYFRNERAIRDASINFITHITKPYNPETDYYFLHCHNFETFLKGKIARLSQETINYSSDLSNIDLDNFKNQSDKNNSEIQYPKFFNGKVSYDFFLALQSKLDGKNKYSKNAFIFHALKRHNYIEAITQLKFIEFLKSNDFIEKNVIWDQLKFNNTHKRKKEFDELKLKYPLQKKLSSS